MPCAATKSWLYPSSPTRAQPAPNGLRKKFGTAMPTTRVSRVAARNPLGEPGYSPEHLRVVALDVDLVGLQFGVRPATDDHRQTVVRHRSREPTVVADVHLEPSSD